MKLNKFLPLEKMQEQPDGTLHVTGIVTAQVPDLEKEVCDYEGTKANYQKRAAENLQKTSVAGMTPSVMPFREMHQLITQGAGRSIDYDDAGKLIRMTFHVVDENAVKKWKAGCFVGFSQGGAYEKKWADPEFEGCTRYIADPSEVSAVDAPCLPIALVESMKGRRVALAKVDGATEEVALQTEVSRIDRLEKSVERLVEAMEKRDFDTTQREHAATTGAALPDGSFPIENEQDLKNAIHAFGRAKDKDKAKAHIEARARALGLTHLLPEEWSGSKKAASGGEGARTVKITDQAGLTKAAKTIEDHLENLKEKHKTHGEQMEKAHEAIQKRHEAFGDHIEKCLKCAKDAAEGEEPEAAEKVAKAADEKFAALEKALTDLSAAHATQVADMKKAHEDLVKKLEKTPAAGGAHAGVDVNDLTKGAKPADVPAGLEGVFNTAPVQ
jgi:hypothetical protein